MQGFVSYDACFVIFDAYVVIYDSYFVSFVTDLATFDTLVFTLFILKNSLIYSVQRDFVCTYVGLTPPKLLGV